MRKLLFLLGMMAAFNLHAEHPHGFLWYDLEKKARETKAFKLEGISFQQLSFTEKDAILRFYTLEALHKARYTKSIHDMKVFLSLQDYWLKESSQFAQVFQKTMLQFPELDYTVTHPTSNLGTKILSTLREEKRRAVIEKLSQSHGILFFYRGKSEYDKAEAPVIRDFCNRYHLPLIPVSVDGISSEELPATRFDAGQANALGVRFFPALLLVNPTQKTTLPIAYGFTTQDVLEMKLVQVATGFHGVGL